MLHQYSTATAQKHALTGFHSVGVLDIVSTMPAPSSVAKASHNALLNRLATSTGATCGLGRMRICVLLLLLIAAPFAQAQLQVDQEPLVFESPAQQERFNALVEELRCLVCQNQNLADSDAPLAHDLRRDIHDMMQAGQSDAQIKQFLIERYGDFVLYRPPVQGNTLILWFAPALLLLGGAATVIYSVRRRKRLLSERPGSGDA